MKSVRISIDEIIAEFFGMFLLVFIPALIEMQYGNPSFTGISLFLLYSFLTYTNFRFSAAHLNPAVTLSYYLAKEISVVKMGIYFAAQFGASFLGGFLLLFFKKFNSGYIGQPWLGKIPNTDNFVVSPIQGRI